MNKVHIEIGGLVFTRVAYDTEEDVLYLHRGEPQETEPQETPEGHIIRYALGRKEIVGLTVVNVHQFIAHLGYVPITLPQVCIVPQKYIEQLIRAGDGEA